MLVEGEDEFRFVVVLMVAAGHRVINTSIIGVGEGNQNLLEISELSEFSELRLAQLLQIWYRS